MLTESQIKRLKQLANIKESKDGDIELYHVTVTNADLSILHSLKQGVTVKKSIGMAASQGSGFYLFKNKESALKRAFSDKYVSTPDGYRPFNKKEDGNRLLVTLKFANLDPNHFDLDAEISMHIILPYIQKYISELEKVDLGMSSGNAPKKFGVSMTKYETLKFIVPSDDPTSHTGVKSKSLSPKLDNSDEITKPDADIVGTFINLIEKKYPDLFNKIETEMLFDKRLDAIKYDGEEVIKPYKLEIINDDKSLTDVTNTDPK